MSAVVQERSPLEQPYEATTRSASAGTKEINQLQPNVRDTAKRLWRNLKSWMFVNWIIEEISLAASTLSSA